jgi:cyclase
MLRPRFTPCLLVHKGGLVKTIKFKDPKYVGDPVNAVKIFNEKEADELVVLDIDATVNGKEPDYKLISSLAVECRMPLCYGGGVRTAEQAMKIVGLGVEKVALSAAAVSNPGLVGEIAAAVGRQSVVVVLDVGKKSGFFTSGYHIFTHNGVQEYKVDPVEFAQRMESEGAGEIVVNCIDRDGVMKGYDIELARQFRGALGIPLSFVGGAGSLEDMEQLIRECGVVGAVAGSLFVFKGVYRAVLINYPSRVQKDEIFHRAIADV